MTTVWHLKKGSEKKFRSGHPWVFSSELAQSPKALPPGSLVELRDHQGTFLARGYGHPNSMISFRTLSLRERDVIDENFFVERFRKALRAREIAGLDRESHRFCFAEGDFLPGLVIDRYRLSPEGQVFVIQSSTAGMDAQLSKVFAALEVLVKEKEGDEAWKKTSIVLANDSKSRLMEGLTADPKKVVREGEGFQPESARLLVQAGLPDLKPAVFEADLIGGQKTGFFLDQRSNIQIVSRFAKQLAQERKEIRVLDLCCYIGQWGTQLSHVLSNQGVKVVVTSVDASAHALEQAGRNVIAHGGESETVKLDVMASGAFDQFENRSFDIVICDPPAFIKKKKDLPTGTQAYYKMNREAIRKTKGGGIYVSCSCSGLFTEEDFREMLSRVVASVPETRWIARGGHSPDHPQRPEFPQGTYLKGWIGIVP